MAATNVEKLGNAAPLGLLGFGITTILISLSNAGLYPLDSTILAMGLAYGGLAQVIAGSMEYRRGNTFGTVAFSSYGLFWWSLVLLLILPNLVGAKAPTSTGLAAYFFWWGVVTLAFFIGSLRANRALQIVLILLTILFFLLSATEATGSSTLGVISGIVGVIDGFSAFYLAIAEVLNEMYKKTVLPIGPVSK